MRCFSRFWCLSLLTLPSLLVVSCVLSTPGEASQGELEYGRLREEMVTTQLEARDIWDHGVLKAMRAVPRHLFVCPRESSLMLTRTTPYPSVKSRPFLNPTSWP